MMPLEVPSRFPLLHSTRGHLHILRCFDCALYITTIPSKIKYPRIEFKKLMWSLTEVKSACHTYFRDQKRHCVGTRERVKSSSKHLSSSFVIKTRVHSSEVPIPRKLKATFLRDRQVCNDRFGRCVMIASTRRNVKNTAFKEYVYGICIGLVCFTEGNVDSREG